MCEDYEDPSVPLLLFSTLVLTLLTLRSYALLVCGETAKKTSAPPLPPPPTCGVGRKPRPFNPPPHPHPQASFQDDKQLRHSPILSQANK